MSGGWLGSVGTKPPRKIHWQWSHPLENDQRPEMTYPPSARTILPVGAYDDEMRALESRAHTSSCAASANSASCQECTPTTPSTQALDGHASATSICTSKNMRGCIS